MTEDEPIQKRKRRKRRRSTRSFRVLLLSMSTVFVVIAGLLLGAHLFRPQARLWRLGLGYAACGILIYLFLQAFQRIDRHRKRRYSKR